MDNKKQSNPVSRFEHCKERLNELDKENISLSKKMHSDDEGPVHKDDMMALKRNNKEMYEIRLEIKKHFAERSFRKAEYEKQNSKSEFCRGL